MGKKTTNSFFPCFSDESLDGGVALNVDFMEELSQAVRLVREDLTLLSKAVRDAAMKLSALQCLEKLVFVIQGKSITLLMV